MYKRQVVNQVAFRVIGNDLTVTIASEAGQLELNVMEPIIVHCLFESIEMLINAMNTLREKCIAGITANEEVCRRMVFNSIGLVTALNPYPVSYTHLACEELRAGKLEEQFVVDMVQGGAGTSTNMNANEVIANRALELLGHEKGEYQFCHPNNHVNLSQSTNDAYPTACLLYTSASGRCSTSISCWRSPCRACSSRCAPSWARSPCCRSPIRWG